MRQPDAERTANMRARREAAGLCRYCGKRPPATGRKMCAECIEGNRQKNREYYHGTIKSDPRYKEYMRQWRARNAHRGHGYAIKYKYGLTTQEYTAMVIAQGGRCAICNQPPSGRFGRLVVDHNHRTGKVRGLLCSWCNYRTGFLEDDPERMRRCADYLLAHLAE